MGSARHYGYCGEGNSKWDFLNYDANSSMMNMDENFPKSLDSCQEYLAVL